MNWRILAGGLGLGVVLVVVLLLVAAIGGIWWFVSDDGPLLYYDARPALVDESALAGTGYVTVNDTAFNTSYSIVPFVGRDVRVRTWMTVYAGGVDLPPGSGDGPAAEGTDRSVGSETGPVDGAEPVDLANVSLVTVFSMSALKLGPVAFNPVTYATDPGLLNASGVLIDHAETWLPSNVSEVSNVDVRSTRDVRLLGQETQLTTFTGELTLVDATDEPTDLAVRFYLARTVRDGELVVVLGMAPQRGDVADAFTTLVEGVRMGEWGASPGWNPPTPARPPDGAPSGMVSGAV